MSGLFKRLSSRRSGGPEGTEPPAAAEPGTTDAPANTPAEPEGHRPLFSDPAAETRMLQDGETSGDQPADPHTHYARPAPDPAPAEPPVTDAHTLYGPLAQPYGPEPAGAQPYYGPADPNAPAPFAYAAPVYVPPPSEPVADLPAGLDPDELGAPVGTSARRGKLRRRAAFLRAARELLLRDLGGFVYELHRTAHDVEHPAHRRLRETKLARLERVDAELHAIEMRLDDVRRQVLVREPGVGGECPHCGELFGSAAHYCSHCGNPLTEAARRELAKGQVAAEPVAVAEPAPEPVANADQPTQEIPAPDAAFQWPSRDAGAAAVGTVGAGASGSDAAAAPADGDGETASDATPTSAIDGEAPAGEGDAAGGVTPTGDAESAAAAAAGVRAAGDGEAAGVVTPVGEGDAAERQAAGGDEAAGDETPGGDEISTDARVPGDGEAEHNGTPNGEGDATPTGATENAAAVAADTGTAGEIEAAGDETPVGDGDAADAHAGDDETPVGESDAAEPHAGGGTPVGEGDAAESTPETADAHSVDSAPAGEYAPAPVRSGDPLAPHTNGEASTEPADGSPDPKADGDAPTRDYDTWRGQAANGHDDSILRPVERRP